MSVPNNNDLSQRNTQSGQHDLPISLEPRVAIHINDEPTDEIVDLSTPLDIDQLQNDLGFGVCEIQKALKI